MMLCTGSAWMRAESDHLLSGCWADVNRREGKRVAKRTLVWFHLSSQGEKVMGIVACGNCAETRASATDGLQRRLLNAIIIIPLINKAPKSCGRRGCWSGSSSSSTFQVKLKINSLSLTCSSIKANGFIIAQRTLNWNPEGFSRNTYSSYFISSSFRTVASWSEKKSHKTLQTSFMHCTQWRSELCSLNCIAYLQSKRIWREMAMFV